MIRVVLCDDHAPSLRSYRTLLSTEDDISVVADAANGIEAVECVRQLHPDVVLMDVRMPVLDGIAATRRIHDLFPAVKVVMLTTFDLDEYVFTALRNGASGFILKNARGQDIIDAVRAAASGQAMLSPVVTRRLITAFAARTLRTAGEEEDLIARLSAREHEVLRLVGAGMPNRDIAARMHVTETTVKTYVSRILTKLERRNRVELALLCQQHGLS